MGSEVDRKPLLGDDLRIRGPHPPCSEEDICVDFRLHDTVESTGLFFTIMGGILSFDGKAVFFEKKSGQAKLPPQSAMDFPENGGKTFL